MPTIHFHRTTRIDEPASAVDARDDMAAVC